MIEEITPILPQDGLTRWSMYKDLPFDYLNPSMRGMYVVIVFTWHNSTIIMTYPILTRVLSTRLVSSFILIPITLEGSKVSW